MTGSGPSDDREALLESLAERYLDALQAGESPDRSALLSAHPEIAPALGRRLALVEAMHRMARAEASSRTATVGEDRAIRLRCPQCRSPIQLVEPQGGDVTCKTCGSTFPVDDDAAPTASYIPDLAPRSLGKFQILGVLGRGTFGTVYKARPRARPPRGGEGAAGRVVRLRGRAGAIPPRGAARGEVEPPGRREGAGDRPRGRDALHRQRVRRRPDPGRLPHGRPARPSLVGRPDRADRRRVGIRP